MQLAMSKTREQFPLSEKKPLKKTMPSILSAIVILFISVFVVWLLSFAFLNLSFNTLFLWVILITILLIISCF